MKIKFLLLMPVLAMLFVACGKQCEKCNCWRGGVIVDEYKHCSGNFSPESDHKFYRKYMIETHGLDSVTCK